MSDERYKTSPVVGYIRSAKKSDPRLDEWELQIRAYAAERGYNLVAVLREEGVSGVAAHRPVLQTLMYDLERGIYAGLITPSEQHLGASQIRGQIKNRITECNCWIVTVESELY